MEGQLAALPSSTTTTHEGLTSIDTLFGTLHRHPSLARNLSRNLDSLVHHTPLLHHPRHQSPSGSLLRRKVLASEDNFHGAGLANGVRETLGAAGAGDDAELWWEGIVVSGGNGELGRGCAAYVDFGLAEDGGG